MRMLSNYEKRRANHYNQYSRWYDNQRNSGFYPLINKLEIKKIMPYVRNKKVLEIGCATGIILDKLKKHTSFLRGIDISPEMIKIAKRKGLKVVLSDVVSIPFKDKTFDVVFSLKTLPHVENIRKAISEISRVTKNNGHIFLDFYNPYSFKCLSVFVKGLIINRGIFIRHDTLPKIKNYIPNNLSIESVSGIRIFTPSTFIYNIPLLKDLFDYLEGRFCDSYFKYFGSYLLIKLKKNDY